MDRARHLYTVGKSGSGKSKLLELLIYSDLMNGKGIGVLIPTEILWITCWKWCLNTELKM